MRYDRLALIDLIEWSSEKGLSREQTEIRLRSDSVTLRDKWNQGSKSPDTFYRDECLDEYLYDLTAWHASGTINSWFNVFVECLRGRKPGRLLDYGAGIGTYSLIAAHLGWEVDACDINAVNLEYIKWRANKHTLPLNAVTEPSGTYDGIICIDTIEHLAEPHLFPAYAHSLLTGYGFLVATWTFHQSGGMHPMHHTEEQLATFLPALRQHFPIVSNTWPVVLEKR